MTWLLRWSALVLVVGFTLPLLAADEAKKPDEKKDAEKKADDKKGDTPKDEPKKDEEKKEKLIPAGQVTGKITKLDENKQTLKLEVAFTIPKLNEGEAQAYMNAQMAYQQAFFNRNPQQRLQAANKAMQDMQTHGAKIYTYEKKTQELEFQLIDEAKIRTAEPPIAFDDDGKQKKYTKKELAELKGDPKLPGYTAEFSTLGTGQYVQVTLVRKKGSKPDDKDPANKGVGGVGGYGKPGLPGMPKPKDAMNNNPDLLTDNLPLASVVVIGQQPAEKK